MSGQLLSTRNVQIVASSFLAVSNIPDSTSSSIHLIYKDHLEELDHHAIMTDTRRSTSGMDRS